MPDDSVSEITDLDEDEILAKYYKTRLHIITTNRKNNLKLDSGDEEQ